MNTPLLETKLLVPPLQAGLIRRPRLLQRLEDDLARKLALVCAPPGFGKTTTLSEYAHTAGRPVAWLSLDEGDNDPARFLFYLIGAIQKVDGELGRSALAHLLSPPMPAMSPAMPAPGTSMDGFLGEAGLAALLNDILASGKPLSLVLDDYHLIQAAGVHQAVGYLLEHQPPQLLIILSTRQDPPLPLARLRARARLVEIRERHLRFTSAEISEFLQDRLGAPLAEDALELLAARTEGWAAGLQLAALSMQEAQTPEAFLAGFAGDNRDIADYLFEEVFQRQPADIQEFLLHTSIPERINASLAETLLGDWLPAAGQALLERCEAAQLFLLSLDHNRQWYRYHHLFRDLLRRLQDEHHPGRAAELHRRASQWYEQAAAGGLSEEAVEHAFAVPDIQRAAILVERFGSTMIYGGRIATFMNWIGRIPDEVIFTHPYLCLDCGWAYAFALEIEAAERYARAGEAALFDTDFAPVSIAGRDHLIGGDEIRGDLTTLRAYCARLRGDTPAVIHFSELALEQLPPDAYTVRGTVALNLGLLYYSLWEWEKAQRTLVEAFETARVSGENLFVVGMALSMLGKVYEQQGRLDEAIAAFERAIEVDVTQRKVIDPIPAACIAYLGLAQVYYQRNILPAAAEYLGKALDLAQQAGNANLVLGARLLETWLALLVGELDKAGDLLEQTAPASSRYQDALHDSEWTGLCVELHLAKGEMDPAVKLLARRELQPLALPAELEGTRMAGNAGVFWERLREYLLLARLLLLQGWANEAIQLLEQLAPLAQASRSLEYRLETNLLLSNACQRKQDIPRAMAFLEEALALAEPQGIINPFIRFRALVDPQLRLAAQPGGGQSDYAQVVQAALAGHANRDTSRLQVPASAPHDSPIEPLTQREHQVLRLLAAGLTSNQVAGELVISVSTVRSYIKVIYGKLNAHSRDEAIARGRKAGLLK